MQKSILKSGKKGLTQEVLEVYKKAAQELIREDERVYKNLLENGTITQEQYDALLLGKVTIGLGYNDIADALRKDNSITIDTKQKMVEKTERLPYLYSDAQTQYTVTQTKETTKSSQNNIYVHQDNIKEYDKENIDSVLLFTLKRMESNREDKNYVYITDTKSDENVPESEQIMKKIAKNWKFDTDTTRVMATARIALVFSELEDKVIIGDVLHAPIKDNITDEQKKVAEEHIRYQLKKAILQIKSKGKEIDLSELDKDQLEMMQSIIDEIEKEENEK